MSATVTSPRYCDAASSAKPTFSATNVTVRLAAMHTPSGSPVSQSSPLGHVDGQHRHAGLVDRVATAGNGSRGGRSRPVPKTASTTNASRAASRSGVERPGGQAHGRHDRQLDQRIAAVLGRVDEQADRHVRPAVVQVPGGGQPVAAVVAAAAQDQHRPGRPPSMSQATSATARAAFSISTMPGRPYRSRQAGRSSGPVRG